MHKLLLGAPKFCFSTIHAHWNDTLNFIYQTILDYHWYTQCLWPKYNCIQTTMLCTRILSVFPFIFTISQLSSVPFIFEHRILLKHHKSNAVFPKHINKIMQFTLLWLRRFDFSKQYHLTVIFKVSRFRDVRYSGLALMFVSSTMHTYTHHVCAVEMNLHAKLECAFLWSLR